MKKGSLILFLLVQTINFYAQKHPVDYVNVFTGTSNSRWMLFPGPTMPFGMVKLSPDNQSNVWNGGYEYTINSISGFSHIHSWSMAGLSIMPTTGKIKTFPGPADGPFAHMWTAGFRSRFLKEEEEGSVGYYKVRLFDYDITTELTTTTRCGYLRFTFPKNKQSNLLFNFAAEYEENDPKILGAWFNKINDREIEGYIKQYSSFVNDYVVYFVVRFNKDIKEIKGWEMKDFEGSNLYGTDWQTPVEYFDSKEKRLSGRCGMAVIFETEQDEIIEVQTGISLVNNEQARQNLESEMKPFDWNFYDVVDHHRKSWNKLLGKIEIQDDNEENISKFYTNLYRAYAARTIWSDVNGMYTDMCEKPQQLTPPADAVYGSDALWGAHWNLFPLWTLLTPDIANSWINSLLEMYDKGGWLPQGPEGVEYAEVMVGSHQIKLIVSAYQKGIRNFDVEKAYKAIYKNQTVPGHKHECGGWVGQKNLDSYMKHGYVTNEAGPVSNTLEIAFDDWALAQFAKALGKKKDYKYFLERSQNYKNIFDSSTRFMRQKHESGEWVSDWDSLTNHGTWYGPGYVEGTAWHYSFFVPHDFKGLIELVGEKKFVDRLEKGFEKHYIDIGNQPNMQAPFIFNYTNKPWLTQKYTRQLVNESFNLNPLHGWPGEEDQGQLGAWFALASIGLFQVDGGCAGESVYTMSGPLFEQITIHLDDHYYSGKDLVIKTFNNTEENIYIQSVYFNKKKLNGPWINHKEIINGGELVFELGNQPNKEWGVE